MFIKRHNLWEEGEYAYPMSFGFCPNIVSYLHDEDRMVRPCIIVVPGGGYRMVSPSEGEIVAKEFYEKGYQAFVCTYTVNLTGEAPLGKQPMKDLSRAIRYIRRHAEEFCVHPGRIVLCGFSAGGHLCGSICVHNKDIGEENPEYAGYSNRPDAAVLCYPVVTTGKYAHRDSFMALFGKNATDQELVYASLERHVTAQTPPCFLWQTATDELVPVENSYQMAEALRKHGVPFAHHVFSHGLHGSSLANDVWANGEFGEPYTMEQIFNLVELVKNGGFPCGENEKRMLLEAFDYSIKTPEELKMANIPNQEAKIWPELANQWLCEIWQMAG